MSSCLSPTGIGTLLTVSLLAAGCECGLARSASDEALSLREGELVAADELRVRCADRYLAVATLDDLLRVDSACGPAVVAYEEHRAALAALVDGLVGLSCCGCEDADGIVLLLARARRAGQALDEAVSRLRRAP